MLAVATGDTPVTIDDLRLALPGFNATGLEGSDRVRRVGGVRLLERLFETEGDIALAGGASARCAVSVYWLLRDGSQSSAAAGSAAAAGRRFAATARRRNVPLPAHVASALETGGVADGDDGGGGQESSTASYPQLAEFQLRYTVDPEDLNQVSSSSVIASAIASALKTYKAWVLENAPTRAALAYGDDRAGWYSGGLTDTAGTSGSQLSTAETAAAMVAVIVLLAGAMIVCTRLRLCGVHLDAVPDDYASSADEDDAFLSSDSHADLRIISDAEDGVKQTELVGIGLV
jgi:hypothetical protein